MSNELDERKVGDIVIAKDLNMTNNHVQTQALEVGVHPKLFGDRTISDNIKAILLHRSCSLIDITRMRPDNTRAKYRLRRNITVDAEDLLRQTATSSAMVNKKSYTISTVQPKPSTGA